jgi:hypothetical protein
VASDFRDELGGELSLRSKMRASPSTSASNLRDLDRQVVRLIDLNCAVTIPIISTDCKSDSGSITRTERTAGSFG